MPARFLGCFVLALLLLFNASLHAQAPAQPPTAFEVASIRMVGEEAGRLSLPRYPATSFTAENVSLKLLIAFAYQKADYAVENGPEWLASQKYSVSAKPEGDAALTFKQYSPLLRKLLEERFHLKAHTETREVEGYALKLAKGGPKLTPATEAHSVYGAFATGIETERINMENLASLLTRTLGKTVVDQTGLEGVYKIKIRFAGVNDAESELPSLFSVLQEQLGLRLERQKVPQEVVVVDSVDKVPTAN